MGNVYRLFLFGFLLLTASSTLKSQVRVNNLLEYQYGKIPNDIINTSTLYDRAVTSYTYKRFKAGLTLEQYHTKFGERNYIKPTQYSLQYNSDPLEVKIGNLYETIGRGILLRSYEIPGAILEDLSYRSRTYFHRDIFGVSTKFRHKNFSIGLLYGKPLNNLFPPSQPDSLRRTDIVKAVNSEYSIKKQTFGAALLHIDNSQGRTLYSMATASGTLFPFLSYYTEVAKNLSGFSISDFSDNSSFAVYGSVNITLNRLGISMEYKKYNNFLIGAGINEPPALIKEHTYKVLNRSTHVLQPINETGYQFEMFYTFPNMSTLTLNNTLAINYFNKKYLFQEYFAGYDFILNEVHDLKFFADFAVDPFKNEMNRFSAGTYSDWKLFNYSTIKADYEFQQFERSGVKVQNHVFILGYGYKSKIAVSIISEISTDPFLISDKTRTWVGTNLKYQVNNKNTIQLFAGQRRGGPACNAGVCYEVLDFEGVELRITSRF